MNANHTSIEPNLEDERDEREFFNNNGVYRRLIGENKDDRNSRVKKNFQDSER